MELIISKIAYNKDFQAGLEERLLGKIVKKHQERKIILNQEFYQLGMITNRRREIYLWIMDS